MASICLLSRGPLSLHLWQHHRLMGATQTHRIHQYVNMLLSFWLIRELWELHFDIHSSRLAPIAPISECSSLDIWPVELILAHGGLLGLAQWWGRSALVCSLPTLHQEATRHRARWMSPPHGKTLSASPSLCWPCPSNTTLYNYLYDTCHQCLSIGLCTIWIRYCYIDNNSDTLNDNETNNFLSEFIKN